jgi:hypothetical protein
MLFLVAKHPAFFLGRLTPEQINYQGTRRGG